MVTPQGTPRERQPSSAPPSRSSRIPAKHTVTATNDHKRSSSQTNCVVSIEPTYDDDELYGGVDSVQASGWLPYQRKKKRRKTSAMSHLTSDTSDTSNSVQEDLMKDSFFGIPRRTVKRDMTRAKAWNPLSGGSLASLDNANDKEEFDQKSCTYRVAKFLQFIIKLFNLLIAFPWSLFFIIRPLRKNCPCMNFHMNWMGFGTFVNCALLTSYLGYRNNDVHQLVRHIDHSALKWGVWGLIFTPAIYGIIFLFFTIFSGTSRTWARGLISEFFNINVAFVHGNTLIWILPIFSLLVSCMILGTVLILAHSDTSIISKIGAIFGVFQLIFIARSLVRMLMRSDRKVLNNVFPDQLSQIEISNFLRHRLTITLPSNNSQEHVNVHGKHISYRRWSQIPDRSGPSLTEKEV